MFLRREFVGMASPSAVDQALAALCIDGMLWRIGTGIYARTRTSSVTGALIPAGSLESLAGEALQKLGVEFRASRATRAYNERRTTQLPGTLVVNVGGRRISRRIEVGGMRLYYERG
ncbi:MAG: S-adenosylhomocysteine hydrolase [Alcaligenaceae bacterium]|nr:MAG: S-adenosylhomocysteine hydrolase [Alcaligenaceae bacterium]